MAPFLSSLASKKTLLRKCLDDFSLKLDAISWYRDLILFLLMRRPNCDRATKLNVTIGDGDSDSFLLQTMSPLYETCANVKGEFGCLLESDEVLSRDTGRNTHTQRCTLLADAMRRGQPFAGFCTKIKESIEKEIDEHQPGFSRGVQMVFDMVLEDFNSTISVEEIPDPKRDILKSQIQQFVDHAQAVINGPLATELATAMADPE